MKKLPRRQMLKALALSGVTAALPKLTHARSIFGRKRKPIREFGRVYDYLKDAQLRLKEMGKQRITIENADFSGTEFNGSSWGYCDFVGCDFTGGKRISLEQLANCTFTNCAFSGIIGFGYSRDSRFVRCKFEQGYILVLMIMPFLRIAIVIILTLILMNGIL